MTQLVRVIRILDRDQVIEDLAKLREAWQEAAGDQSLIQVEASVGLILDDISKAIGLTPEEQEQALGTIYQEIQALEGQPVYLTVDSQSLQEVD